MPDAVPAWLATMRQIDGTNAVNDNAVIVGWAQKIGELFPDMAPYCANYTNDSIAWCGLTVGYCMAINGIKPVFGATDTDKFLYALAWKQFGTPVTSPQPGDVLVFYFGGSDHHVTLYEQTQGDCYVCRGGNQSNEVKLSNYAITQCLGIYRPPAATISVPVVASPPLTVKLNSGITATVFGGVADHETSAYDGHVITDTELGVALPYHFPGARPNVCVWNAGKSVVCKIVDVGPWNTDDPYWQTGTRPEAESGVDNTGRKTNLAGIDLTPAAASAIGIAGKGIVDWEFVDGSQPEPTPQAATTSPALSQIQQLINQLEVMMAGTTTIPAATTTAAPAATPAAQVNLALLIQQVLTLAANAKSNQPGATPPSAPSQDQIQQFISILSAVAGSPTGQKVLGQVNGALGQTIGNLLDGKKSAIGIIGATLTAVLQSAGPTLSTNIPIVGSWAGLGSAAIPVFLGITAWGILGKVEKWVQSLPKSSS
jgi:uncharacterized protein (TIGR02594 family)